MSSDKYGHEEILPDVEFITEDVERWKDMVRRLQERIEEAEELVNTRAHWVPDTEESVRYETETWKETEIRDMERQVRPEIVVRMAERENWKPGIPVGDTRVWRCGLGRGCANEERRDRVGYYHEPRGSDVRVGICERCWSSDMYVSGALVERIVREVARERVK